MDGNGRVHPYCPNAANPYHECGVLCLEKIAEGKGTKAKEKKTLSSKFLDASRSFDRKNKSESLPQNHGYPRSLFSSKKTEAENGESFSSSEQHSGEIYSQDQSFEKAPIQYSQPLQMSGKLMSPADAPAKFKQEEKVQDSPKMSSGAHTKDAREALSSAFSFLGIGQAQDDSDEEEEVESVISDSCVSVGKYHVKASMSTVLQSIFDKHGDIAANCHLESASMRAYYLECLCAVVQELHSTPFKQLTKAKLKEMFAVLKDVDSAGIVVSWLRALLNEISEAVELVSQRQTFEAKKAKHDQALESVRKELKLKTEDLAQKEKEAAFARERVAETKARLDEIERQCSELDKTISNIASIIDKFGGKSLADEFL
ncbi:Phospholipase-like protein family, putative isoform 2 [Hibiscus syriacus]|uniref:Phospholipase-like protein family, putative isoform 2 n=1 Tax=Hibiscus syriacus TaxID=106335 RepID=A0A6A2X8L0_HIBSY|nr:uncharacterized protein LOC120184815 [Hibiscus syriacus]XP_039045125.1 uncharacterized protein LOC120184815 [Hibiscus syriacus]XP_039045126.1 uncharacterized protein LOC120184815 [Hibiscus syriacus]KAE8663525.1 Phospholipase-like protein family, putative isoform 2 [Hibiscus syriacus]